ncbi:FAD-dependent oxidoreductase [Dactylosporangium sp. McL0621]|uniref:FAD-dependent oxidoreductase n=1 Tax=Dactylosporangium sp. McL0621 TaxID=3415678 RepID=UPI003CEF049B
MSEPLIVGAGIGGLTAAVALAAHGRSCTVVERSPALSASGYGIQLPPNATRVLAGLGLGPALEAVSLRLEAREIRRWADGSLLGSAALDRWDAPYLSLRRAALLRVLHSRIAGVQFGRSFGSADERLVVGADGLHSAVRGRRASDGFGRSFASADGRLVVGADGLHSTVRGRLASDGLVDVGYTAYRAVLPVRDARPVVSVWLGPGAHVVAYPVPDGLNVVAVTDGLHSFDGWDEPVRALARACMRGFVLYTRAPLPAWHRDGVVVIGDAAHPMPPFLAQGAAQAIEDAAALPDYLDDLAGFEAARRPRVERVVAVSVAGGHEYHLADGAEQRRRDKQIAAAEPPGQDWLYT